MADFGMAAFSLFFMQSPSFLEPQRRIEQGSGRSDCQSLFDGAATERPSIFTRCWRRLS
jgi:hypothetical protein